MSDHHPKGMPDIPGLGPGGSSIPPEKPYPPAWFTQQFSRYDPNWCALPAVPLSAQRKPNYAEQVIPKDLWATCEKEFGPPVTTEVYSPAMARAADEPNPYTTEQSWGRGIPSGLGEPLTIADSMHLELCKDFPFILEQATGHGNSSQAAPAALEAPLKQQAPASADPNLCAVVPYTGHGNISQHQPSPAAAHHGRSDLDIQQIASLNRPGPTFAPPGLGYSYAHAVRYGGARFPPPGLPHPRRIQFNPAHPVPTEPGHAHGDPGSQIYQEVPQFPPLGSFKYSPPRRFKVTNVDTDLEAFAVLREFKDYETTIGPFFSELNTKGQFYIGFSDLNDALKADEKFKNMKLDWEIHYMEVEEFDIATNLAFPLPTELDDTVIATLYCGPQSVVNASNVTLFGRQFLELVGPVYSCDLMESSNVEYSAVVRSYDLEVRYRHLNSAVNAIRALNGVRTEGQIIEVMARDSGHFATSTRARHEYEAGVKARQSGRRAARTPSSRGKPGRRPPLTPRGEEPAKSPRERENEIDLNEISYGRDQRTAVMCRNIPVKMHWRDLKGILDKSSAGRYNYLYLRMDFGANLNVGYAFINFEKPADIITFVRARAGRTWPGFERWTDKIAEITYADVQGIGTLVERFRNSPIILNLPDNRPKLFHTRGPKQGAEASFPPVNNFYTLSMGVQRSQGDAGM